MAVTLIGGHKNGQNLKNPQLNSQEWPNKKPPQNRGGFLLRFWFLLSQCLCLFLLVSPYFLLFHDILEPQNSPPNEVTGYMAVYIYMLWSYYLGHVWGFLIVTNWATFVFLKRLFVKTL